MPARQRRSRSPNRTHGGARAGFVLLDLVIALALFVVGGLAVLTQMESGARRVISAEHRLGAAGVARSAIALLEAGAMSDRELSGPASAWAMPADALGSMGSMGSMGAAGATGERAAAFFCEVELEPSQWPELSLAIVRVRRVPAGADADDWPVLATLRQLVPSGAGMSGGPEPSGGGS